MKGESMDTLKWTITDAEKRRREQAKIAVNRILTKAEQEKEAKANGLWDYRNNKIVEA